MSKGVGGGGESSLLPASNVLNSVIHTRVSHTHTHNALLFLQVKLLMHLMSAIEKRVSL